MKRSSLRRGHLDIGLWPHQGICTNMYATLLRKRSGVNLVPPTRWPKFPKRRQTKPSSACGFRAECGRRLPKSVKPRPISRQTWPAIGHIWADIVNMLANSTNTGPLRRSWPDLAGIWREFDHHRGESDRHGPESRPGLLTDLGRTRLMLGGVGKVWQESSQLVPNSLEHDGTRREFSQIWAKLSCGTRCTLESSLSNVS